MGEVGVSAMCALCIGAVVIGGALACSKSPAGHGAIVGAAPPDGGSAPDGSTAAASRGDFVLVARSGDGAVWAYRRSAKGPIKIARTRDWSLLGTFPLAGEHEGDTITTFGGAFPGTRFCADGRFAILSHSPSLAANVWDPKDGVLRPVGAGASLRDRPGPEGSPEIWTLGWSDTCELVATGGPEPLSDAGVADDTGPTRVPIRLLGPDTDQTLHVKAAREENVSVLDVTADAVLIALSKSTGRMGAHRLGMVDRKTGTTRVLARTLLFPSTWARLDSRSFVIAPTFAEGPHVVRVDAELDPAARMAFAHRGLPRTSNDFEPPLEVPVAAVDPTKTTVAMFEGNLIAWWSFAPRRRIATQRVEPFEQGSSMFRLAFLPDGGTTVAFDAWGNVLGVGREPKRAYRHALARAECPSSHPCADGNREQLASSRTSEDGAAIAIGSTAPARSSDGGAPHTVVIDLANGALRTLPTPGDPVGFLDGHAKLVIDEEIWSIAEGRVVGHLPD